VITEMPKPTEEEILSHGISHPADFLPFTSRNYANSYTKA
jgi:hypothetical protein